MSIYSFPVLKMSEIVLFIRNSKLGISEEDIKNCEPAAVRRFFEAFFDVILDISKDDLTQPALSGLSVLPHPNLHEDSIPELAFFRTSKKLLEACGVTDFTWQDIQKPKLKRLRYLLSAIINFSKFKEERKLHFDKYLKTTVLRPPPVAENAIPLSYSSLQETLLRAKQQKEDENATLRRQLEELKAKQAAEAPALQAVIDECSVMEAEINVLNTRQSLLHPEVKALKAQVAKLNDELQSLNFDIVEGKKTIRSMESKVVNSPARQRSVLHPACKHISMMYVLVPQEIASLAQQVDVAKEEVNALDGRSAELDVIHSTVMTTLSHGRKGLQELLQRNKKWAHDTKQKNPTYFSKLVDQQSPEVLWIASALIVECDDDERTVSTDLNALSVLEYAVTALKVKHIIVCTSTQSPEFWQVNRFLGGHYGCGGVHAAMTQKEFGLVDNWLRSIKDIYSDNANVLGRTLVRVVFGGSSCVKGISDEKKRSDLLTELNVAKAVYNVCHTRIVQNAWQSGQELHIHGWLKDGIIRDLKICISGEDQVEDIYRKMQEKENPET
ncbi:hypothetical protein DYB32_002830 [Aphanomyces invadans]|uniref:carbonic anhydrase n=1 Tax=Aphanomyces invadans TaxID=157072 RepID=A0A3R6VE43_9STRA|nr:hypothetical protein DYB32_002830 [Aphanomyces invadans]